MDQIYNQISDIMLGRREESALAKRLKERFSLYGIQVLEVYHFRTQRGYQCKIYIERETLPASRFRQISKDEEAFVRGALEKAGVKEKLDTIDIRFADFISHAKYQIMWQAVQIISEKQEQQYPDVWKFHKSYGGSAVVFYFTDKDVKRKEINGRSQEIRRQFHDTICDYDELRLFGALESVRIRFDSKERLDRDFGGSIFGYDR